MHHSGRRGAAACCWTLHGQRQGGRPAQKVRRVVCLVGLHRGWPTGLQGCVLCPGIGLRQAGGLEWSRHCYGEARWAGTVLGLRARSHVLSVLFLFPFPSLARGSSRLAAREEQHDAVAPPYYGARPGGSFQGRMDSGPQLTFYTSE